MSEEKQPYRIEGRVQTIYRVVKSAENPYVMIDRRPIDNKKMSWKAKGMLTYLMSRPDGWEVSVADLINHATDGEASTRSGLRELRDAGHMKYTKMREKGRITGWLIEVFEIPDGDFLHVEKQDVENRRQVLKKLSNTKLSNIKPSADKPAIPQEVKLYREVTGKYPNRATYESVQKIFESVSARLGRTCTADDLRPFYTEWTFRGFNPVNMNWTSWAVTGIIPIRAGLNTTTKQDQSLANIQSWLSKQEVNHV